ncbi:MAG: hypothetical protein ATN35_13320 [Epulopiscium sp. Nele67-Bin004]|nr:MAG: hypothetical protein ATN35_13320 [Epulopiscium sp. Nele67-Bin004]
MLDVQNLTCGYGEKTVIKDVSFNLDTNQNLCILGLNGCGKSTLLKAINGTLDYSGSIKLFDNEISKIRPSELGQKIATLSQTSKVYFAYKVFDAVMLGRYTKLPKNVFTPISKEHEEYVMYCLDIVGITDLKDQNINTLSGGQMQKVLLARALAQEPQIILLDEPSNHLDIKSQMELFEFLESWTSDGKHNIIGVLHDIGLSLTFFDKCLLLKDGNTNFFGDTSEITTKLLENTYNFDVLGYINKIYRCLESKYV